MKNWFLQAFTGERKNRLLLLYVGGMSLTIFILSFIL